MVLRYGLVSTMADGPCVASGLAMTTMADFLPILKYASTERFGNSFLKVAKSLLIALSKASIKFGAASKKALASAILFRSFSANGAIQLSICNHFLSGPAALERLAFGRKLSEVFRAALGSLFPAQTSGIGGDELIRNPFSAVWAFHVENVQHGLLFVK